MRISRVWKGSDILRRGKTKQLLRRTPEARALLPADRLFLADDRLVRSEHCFAETRRGDLLWIYYDKLRLFAEYIFI